MTALPHYVTARLVICVLLACAPLEAHAVIGETAPWWVWPIALFVVTFLLGIVAVLAGVGGGVLFVPIVGGFFPFHLDFVRGAGLMLALAGALSAGPSLLRAGFASLRLAMPLALVGSIAAVFGASVGLALPQNVVNTALGLTILAIAFLLWRARKSERPEIGPADRIAQALGLRGVLHDAARGDAYPWHVHRTWLGLVLFAGVGFMAGFFGLGAGWANVPVLNLVMGAPLKISVGTSSFMLSIVDTSAAWVYINRGAILPMLTVPSILGMMIGARIGARLVRITPGATIRRIVLALLVVAGLRALLKGLGIWV